MPTAHAPDPAALAPAALPEPLRERTRPVGDPSGPPRPNGAFVVYWMRTAVRGHHNPALDVALTAARELGVPAFVYHALSERYPYASDRHHTFVLEGARDVAAELAALGIGSVFHLERPGHRGAHLKTLARRAALVVTEDFPLPPLRGWTRRLAADSPAPVWAVDTACVVPMRLPGRPYDRAYRYREATAGARRVRLQRGWTDAAAAGELFVPGDLPFQPVDLAGADLPSLVAACEIDHTVGPVPGTPGGSRAGYARWRGFVDGGGLHRYAARRNDPLADGVSRLSPYLHFGQVSPLRIAREAAAVGGKGAETFLDELLVWREMAHTWCFHQEDPERLAALPDWARETLRRHAGDPRPALYPWETLARADVDEGGEGEGARLWNACQRSLLIHGELHNNLRMTWGKALLRWTPEPRAALDLALDLNHRYALDGRDPNSYGGILWCFGGFDRPFDPESPIFGRVRGRSLDGHAGRLDVDRYAQRTGRPAVAEPPRVGVIGAGLAGLACARTLADHGWLVTVVDKGRRPGGRTSTRPTDHGGIDHGAQYFTARSELFRRHVDSWRKMGLVGEWRGRIVELEAGEVRDKARDGGGPERFVGVPGMDAVARHLAGGFQGAGGVLHQGWRAEGLERRDGAWWIVGTDRGSGDTGSEAGPFGVVVAAVPPAQAVPFLAAAPELAARAGSARVRPCWAVLLGYGEPTGLGFDGAFVQAGPLSWVARDSSKPGRGPEPGEPGGRETWVLHAGPEWSAEHLEDDPGAVTAALLAAFAQATGRTLPEPAFATAHRWRFALPDPPLDAPCLFAPDAGLAACGDWCGGPRIEGAFLSGAALAGRLLGRAAAR